MSLNTVSNWLASIPTAIWGSLLTGTMTLLGVLLGQYGLRRREEKQREKEIESLRNALMIELRSADHWLERLLFTAHDLEKAKENAYGLSGEQIKHFESPLQLRLGVYRYLSDQELFSEEIYQTNTDKIGQLDQESARAVVGTYTTLGSLHNSLRGLAEAIEHEELVLNSEIDWSTGAGLKSDVIMHKEQIESTVSRAVILQKMTLLELGDELSSNDRKIITFAYFHLDPQSEDEAQIQQFLKTAVDKYDVSSVEELMDMGRE